MEVDAKCFALNDAILNCCVNTVKMILHLNNPENWGGAFLVRKVFFWCEY